jgi:DNA modification methylase
MPKKKLEIVYVKPETLKPWPDNPKLHDIAAIANSVERFDITQPILVQKKTNRIIAGHGRIKAFEKLGIKEIPVIYLDMDDKAAKAYMLVDNQLTIEGGWDDDLLQKVIGELKIEAPEIKLEELGFEDMLEEMNAASLSASEDEFEPPAEPKNERGIKLGDVFILGKHRVMCGDATKEDDVKRLMDGKKADMVFTDPPYGVGIGAKNRALDEMDKGGRIKTDIENDTMSIDETAKKVWEPAFTNIATALSDGGSYYVTAPQGGDQMMMMMMMKGSMPCKHELIWVKNNHVFSMGRLDYDYKHEPILYGWKGSHKFQGKGKFTKSIWEIPKPNISKLHPTMKPVELVSNAIQNSSISGQIVIDFFLGSGTTLIAAEQLNRICYGMEIDPVYCNVIIDRYEKLTGEKAEKAV